MTVDYTEYLGELNLEIVKVKRVSKKKIKPIPPDGNFKTSWELIGLFLILY